MKQRAVLELDDAQQILTAALVKAQAYGFKVSISICDEGGYVIAQQRMDGAPPMSTLIAPDKARACVLSQRPSKIYEEMVNKGRFAALKLPVVPLEGGEMIVVAGQCVGAIGVSGAASGDDAEVARAGVAAIGASCSF